MKRTHFIDFHSHFWSRVLREAAIEFRADQVSIITSGVAFRATLAIFPAVAVLIWIGSQFIGSSEIQSAIQAMSAGLPDSARSMLSQAMDSPLANNPGQQGSTTIFGSAAPLFGLLFAMWSANSGVKALFVALNTIFDQTERRGFFRLTLITLAFTASALILSLFILALIVIGPDILSFTGISTSWLTAWRFMRWILLMVFITSALGILYRYAPNHEGVRWPFLTIGGLSAALVLTAGSAAFSWFIRSFATLSVTYGSLSTVIAFMIWLWLSFIVVLAGAELDAAIDRNGKGAAKKA